jgi:hypothetical protein
MACGHIELEKDRKISNLQREVLAWCQKQLCSKPILQVTVPLVLGLLFSRAASASTMMEGGARDIAMICQGMTGPVHIVLPSWWWRERRRETTRDGRRQHAGGRWAPPANGKFEKPVLYATHMIGLRIVAKGNIARLGVIIVYCAVSEQTLLSTKYWS